MSSILFQLTYVRSQLLYILYQNFQKTQEDYIPIMFKTNQNNSRSFNFSKINLYTSKSVSTAKLSSTCQFKTIWKYRNSHCTHIKPMVSQNNSIKQCQKQQYNNITQMQVLDAQITGQQEMKQFVKMMKKNSENIQYLHQKQNKSIPDLTNIESQKSRNSQTNRSIRSTKSQLKQLSSSRYVDQLINQNIISLNNTNKNISLNLNSNQQLYNQNPTLTLAQLQKKLQQIMKIKLQKKYTQSRMFNNHSNYNNKRQYKQDDLDKKLKQLIEQIGGYTSRNQQNRMSIDKDKLDQNIKQIAHKISIIQKAIALSSAQNYILKDCYSSKNKSRKFFAKNYQRRYPTTPKPTYLTTQKTQPPIHYQTTNLSTFVQPSKQSYKQNPILKKTQFLLNRQPIPRSLYQRQYLHYGVLPIYCHNNHNQILNKKIDKLKQNNNNSTNINRNKQNCTVMGYNNKQTTYQSQYKQKIASLIDSKDLDCRQDKFKNIGINFIPTKPKISDLSKNLTKKQKQNKSSHPPSITITNHNLETSIYPSYKNTSKQNIKIQHSKNKQNKQNRQNKQNKQNIHIKHKTQFQSQFVGTKNIFQICNKQKNLNNLKYNYKFYYCS